LEGVVFGSRPVGASGRFLTARPSPSWLTYLTFHLRKMYILAPKQILWGEETAFINHLHLSENVFIRAFAKRVFLGGRRGGERNQV
jgi:hypothetical protein